MTTNKWVDLHNKLDEFLEETFGHNDWNVLVQRTQEGTIRIEIEESMTHPIWEGEIR